MEATELMIGDWVFNKHHKKYIQITPYDFFNHAHLPSGEKYFVSELKVISGRDFEPIPLTAEILERNGFSKVPQTECSNPYHWTLERYEEGSEGLLYRIKAYKTLFRGMYVIIYNYADCEQINFGKQIESVHELQHALHLCGLSDLVDKLKVEEKIHD